MPDFLNDPSWLSAIAVSISAVIAVLLLLAGVVRWLYRPWQKRKERRQANQALIYALIRFLENRRALYTDWADEKPQMVINSVREIRSRLMEDIERLDKASDDVPPLLEMQAACRQFLTLAESMTHLKYDLPPHDKRLETFLKTLYSFREVLNTQMDKLRGKYGIEKRPPPEDVNPFIGKRIGRLYVQPPPEFDQLDDEPESDKG